MIKPDRWEELERDKVKGDLWRAWWGDDYVDVRHNRERSYPTHPHGWGELHRPLYEDAIEAGRSYGLGHGTQVLDYGCGSGYGTELLHNAFGSGAAFGCDVSEEAIAFAKKVYPGPFFCVTSTPVGRFDFVTMVEVIEHLEHDVGTLLSLSRLRFDGGNPLLYVTTPDLDKRPDGVVPADAAEYHVREYTWHKLAATLSEGGWRVLERRHVKEFPSTLCVVAEAR